jgi:hypothetical protein
MRAVIEIANVIIRHLSQREELAIRLVETEPRRWAAQVLMTIVMIVLAVYTWIIGETWWAVFCGVVAFLSSLCIECPTLATSKETEDTSMAT